MSLTRSTYVQGAGQLFQDADISAATLAAGTLFQRFSPLAFPQKGVTYSGFLGTSAIAVATLTPGVAAVNEIQTVTLTGVPDGGTFTLTYVGQTTTALAFDIAAVDLQTALEALSNLAPGDVVVSGAGPYTLTFGGTLAGTNVATLTASGAGLTGGTAPAVVVATLTPGVVPVNEVQVITISGVASGTFTLSYAGQTTAAIAVTASAAAVQTALIALSNLAPGDVVVSGSAGGPWTVTFGGTLAGTDVAAETAVNSGSAGSLVPLAARTTHGSGS